jgi:DNA polymerase elongation subunit (family B)
MIDQLDLNNVLVFDIETVSQHRQFADLEPKMQALWELKHERIGGEEQEPGDSYERAGIYAEFGKVICISVGAFYPKDGKMHFLTKTFMGKDERALLKGFAKFLEEKYSHPAKQLCGHNIREFDVPYLCRRMIVNGIRLPRILNLYGKKPWEVNHLDTMQMWKFGDYKSYTSLNLLAAIFGIPTPKDDIDGSMVGQVFWEEDNLERIGRYCEKDVVTSARVLLKLIGSEDLTDDSISSSTFS